MSKRQSLRDRQASSEAAWALIIEGVTAARLEVHRLKHLVSRATKLVDKSKYREHLYQVAGDLVTAIPEHITQTERFLDRTSFALAKMGDDFLGARLSVADKNLVDDSIEAANSFSTTRRSPKSNLSGRVAQRYLKAQEPVENVARSIFKNGYLPGGTKGLVPSISVGFDDVTRCIRGRRNPDGTAHYEGSLIFGKSNWEGGIVSESPLFEDFKSYYPGKEDVLVKVFLEELSSNLSAHKAQITRSLSDGKLLSGNVGALPPQNVQVGEPVILASFAKIQEQCVWVPVGVKVSFDLVG